MNISRFTQKSTEAVQECEKVAMEFGNQELTEEHLLMGLLRIDDSLILNLIEKMGINTEHFINRVNEEIAKKPKVQGGQPYVGEIGRAHV